MSSTTRKYIYTFPPMSRKLKPKLIRNLRQYSTVSLREMTTSGFDNLRDHKNKERLRSFGEMRNGQKHSLFNVLFMGSWLL